MCESYSDATNKLATPSSDETYNNYILADNYCTMNNASVSLPIYCTVVILIDFQFFINLFIQIHNYALRVLPHYTGTCTFIIISVFGSGNDRIVPTLQFRLPVSKKEVFVRYVLFDKFTLLPRLHPLFRRKKM